MKKKTIINLGKITVKCVLEYISRKVFLIFLAFKNVYLSSVKFLKSLSNILLNFILKDPTRINLNNTN